jgi:hypothetical protein
MNLFNFDYFTSTSIHELNPLLFHYRVQLKADLSVVSRFEERLSLSTFPTYFHIFSHFFAEAIRKGEKNIAFGSIYKSDSFVLVFTEAIRKG